MTNFTHRITIVTAAMIFAAGAASAQGMTAEIPFTFRAGGALLAAGAYRVTLRPLGGVTVLSLLSQQGGHSAMLRAAEPHDAPQVWQAAGLPLLSFDCASARCALAGVWGGSGPTAYGFSAPRLGRDEPVRTTLVMLRREKGD